MEFAIGGMAAVGAGFFTNPLDVVKCRMQLQGELQAKGHHAVHYRNVFHATYMIVKHDGVLALQNGLAPALLVQLVLNGIRLGTFQFIENKGYLNDEIGQRSHFKTILGGGFSALVGQLVCTPLFLIKTHQQSQASAVIAVGYQNEKAGLIKSFVNIYGKHGIKGLYRGGVAGIPRASVGSAAQLGTFNYVKEYIQQYENLRGHPYVVSFLGSLVGGVAISIMMTPFDLILTRICNQPIDKNGRGILYTSYFDCVKKVYRAEGPAAFYKGIGPMYLRLGPHTVLCLSFWDALKRLHDKYWSI
ncbi:unnamed protein product [Brassicogethes aeneus]|uniref:Solute carrier family 25 member 35 n=1 Tax=Brassicogethes aeneus TaxID=1431903 RepID=A0A9P0B443_BRAAE|nr:unnamed protein product [Brassicogethes aeneus]